MPEAAIQASGKVQSPREFRPDNYTGTSTVSGQNVLLLDDTWASGGHAESAAAALKRAGAARVTILALARWMQRNKKPGKFTVRELVVPTIMIGVVMIVISVNSYTTSPV